MLCAPTGRTARRMSEATGLEARTIHRPLEVDPWTGRFRRDADNPLDRGVLVVDESSMVDVMLIQALVATVPDTAAVLIVGDVDQLPSVGPGQALADHWIWCGAGGAAHRGLPPGDAEPYRDERARPQPRRDPDLSRPEGGSDFYFVPAEDPETAAGRIVDLVTTRIPKRFGFDPVRDIQILCPMNRSDAADRRHRRPPARRAGRCRWSAVARPEPRIRIGRP